MADTEEVRKRFSGDTFAAGVTGCVIEKAEPGHSVCCLQLTPSHLNAAGTVMGGALFTLADFAFAVAANTDSPLTVSLASNITFVRPAIGEKITAVADCVSKGRTTCLYQVELKNDSNQTVAFVTVNGFIKQD